MFISNVVRKTLISHRTSIRIFRTVSLVSAEKNISRYKSCFSSSKIYFSLLKNKVNHLKKHCLYRNASNEKLSTITSENHESTFSQMLCSRKKQAERSVLLELSNKDDIPDALGSCQKFGNIRKTFSYGGVSENVFLLLEFEDENCVQKLLLSSDYKNLADVFPVLSRIVGYVRKYEMKEQQQPINLKDDIHPSTFKPNSVSDLIENIYTTEKLTELQIRLRFFFGCILKESLSGLFPFCDAIPFGSSVNGIGRHGCDLDIMIRLYPEQQVNSESEFYFVNKTCVGDIQNLQRKVIHCVGDLLRTFSPGVSSVQKILHARVPIIKLDHKILGMKVDISANNMAPVLMSEILHFCGEIDSRLRPLVFGVKRWAKEANITYDVPGSWITNFALTLLVVFFLQNRPQPVLPPLNEMINIIGAECTSEYKLQYLMSLTELQARASLNDESLAFLLKEFLSYLGSQPFEDSQISLLSGTVTKRKTDSPIWVQYPLEEDLNVSKNVSAYELSELCAKARVSAKYLSSSLNSKGFQSKDLSNLLGIPNIRKLEVNKSKRLDVSSLLGEDARNMNKKSSSFRKRTF